MGPLIVKSIKTFHDNDTEIKDYPIDWMPDGIVWVTFRRGLINYAIKEGDYVVLLEYKEKQGMPSRINEIRQKLGSLTIVIKYDDIYGKQQEILERDFHMFKRNLPKEYPNQNDPLNENRD